MKAIKIASLSVLAAAISAQSMATNFLNGADIKLSGSLNTDVSFNLKDGGGATKSNGSVALAVSDSYFSASLTLMGLRDYKTACDKSLMNTDAVAADDVTTTLHDESQGVTGLVNKPGADGKENWVAVANNKDDFAGCETSEKFGPGSVGDFVVNAGNWSFGEIGALPKAKFFPWEAGFVQGQGGIATQATDKSDYGVDYAIRFDSAGLLYGNNIGYWDYKGWVVQLEGQNAANANSGAVYNSDGAEIQANADKVAETVGASAYYYDYLNNRTILSLDAKARQMEDKTYGLHTGAALKAGVAKGLDVFVAAQVATSTKDKAHLYADAGLRVDYKIKSYFTTSVATTYNTKTADDKKDSALKTELVVAYDRKGISAKYISGAIVDLDLTADNLKAISKLSAGYDKDGISAGAEVNVEAKPTAKKPDTDMVLTAAVFAGWNNDGDDLAFEDDVLSFSARYDFANDMADNNGNQEQKKFGVVVGNAGTVEENDKVTVGASYSAEVMDDVTVTASLDDTFNIFESALNKDNTNVLVEKVSVAIVPAEGSTVTFSQTIKHETEKVDGKAKGISDNTFSVAASYSF